MNLDPSDDELDAMNVEQLLDLLSAIRQEILARLAVAAKLFLRLKAKGINLTVQQVPMLPYILMVANKKVLPEVVSYFLGRPSLFQVIGRLPPDEQRRLAAGGTCTVAVFGPNGEITHTPIGPLNMTQQQVEQVFAEDHVRNLEEQAPFLHQQRTRERARRPEKVDDCQLDQELRKARPSARWYTVAELKAIVRALEK